MEVVISTFLLATVSLSVAQVFAITTRSTWTARGQTSATVLAQQKLEQLRSLTWGFDDSGIGLPVSDTTSDLSVTPPTANGHGLDPSAVDSLEGNTRGFVDYLDAAGTWVGNGANPPGSAVYIRRWSIQPLPTNPNNTLIIQVLVTPVAYENGRVESQVTRTRMAGDARLTSIKTRKSR